MFQTIRARLILSNVLLTVLAVGLVGLLALWGLQRYTDLQETRSLTANAQAIAQQAAPLMEPWPATSELGQLAGAAAFFSNSRVLILDAKGGVIADSGRQDLEDELAWIMVAPGVVIHPETGWIIGFTAELQPEMAPLFTQNEATYLEALIDQLPPGTSWTIVRSKRSPWGSRLTFSKDQVEGGTIADRGLTGDSPAAGTGDSLEETFRRVRVPIGEPQDPAGYVELASGASFRAEALQAMRQVLLLAGGAAVLLAVVVGAVISRRLTTPLLALSATARQMQTGDLSVRARVNSPDEIGQLAAAFNAMAAQLQASFDDLAAERDALRRLFADASHELRTPITALKNFNNLLQDQAADDPEARAEFLAESQVQIERLEWLTHNLLDLSRLDAGLAALTPAPVEAGELIADALAPYRKQASGAGIELRVAVPDPAPVVQVDRERMLSALSNLIDNALKFSPPGRTVWIEAAHTGREVRLSVADEGPGIDEADREHIFERFYRGHNVQVPGSGLGLAIVQSVVQAHGGRVEVSNRPGGGAQFHIILPAKWNQADGLSV